MASLIKHVHESLIPDKEALEAGMTLLWKVRTPGTDRTQLYNEIRQIQETYTEHSYVQNITSNCLSYLIR